MTNNDIMDIAKALTEHLSLTNRLTDRIIELEKQVKALEELDHQRDCVDPDHCKRCL